MESYEEIVNFEISIIFGTTDLFSWNTIRHFPHFIPHSFHFDIHSSDTKRRELHRCLRRTHFNSDRVSPVGCRLLETSPQGSIWRYSQSTIIFRYDHATYCQIIQVCSHAADEIGSTTAAAILCSAARDREWSSCNMNAQSENNDADWFELPEVAHLL